MALNNRQTLFLKNYLQTWNATQSAIKAGYSPKTAYSIGHELLNKPEIKRHVAEATMSPDELGAILTDMGRGKPGSEGMPPEPSHQLKALELIGKMHGSFIDKRQVEHSGALQIEFVNDWRANED